MLICMLLSTVGYVYLFLLPHAFHFPGISLVCENMKLFMCSAQKCIVQLHTHSKTVN